MADGGTCTSWCHIMPCSCAWSPSPVLWYYPWNDACLGHAHAGMHLLHLSQCCVSNVIRSCLFDASDCVKYARSIMPDPLRYCHIPSQVLTRDTRACCQSQISKKKTRKKIQYQEDVIRSVQLRVDSRWHPRQAHIHTMACPSAPPLMLGLQRYTNSAPLIYVAGEGNEIVLYDLQNFKTKIKFNAWMPRSPQAQPDVTPVATEISDMQQAKLPGQVREGMRALLPMPSGGLLCAGRHLHPRYHCVVDSQTCTIPVHCPHRTVVMHLHKLLERFMRV